MKFQFKITGPLMDIIEQRGILPKDNTDDMIEVSETDESIIVDIHHPDLRTSAIRLMLRSTIIMCGVWMTWVIMRSCVSSSVRKTRGSRIWI